MMTHPYITVSGTMGSGKTTAARLLSERLGFTLLEENFGDNAFLPRFYRNMKRWSFHSQTFFLMEKITQILETKTVLASQAVVQDTPVEQDVFSYAKALWRQGNMDDAEWKLYSKIYYAFAPYFPVPDLLVYLDTDIATVRKRIASRGRGFEKTIPVKYLKLLDALNRDWTRETKIPTLIIKTEEYNIVYSQDAKDRFVARVKDRLGMLV